jgi:hypothetical protein
MELIVTIEDPTLPRVRYVVRHGLGKPRWFRVEDDTHTALAYVPDRTPPSASEPDLR